jgi:glycolate oxidase FAD binding subunit
MKAQDFSEQLQQKVQQAIDSKQPVKIIGSGSKAFYGRETEGDVLDISAHQGIINYQPKELVVTVRSGTRLADLNAVLAEKGQMLAFEPPAFGEGATIGGTIACGFSGPRRAAAGSARDFVLGTSIINGRAELLRFGGEVMKNVAGYDVSRLMVGAMGTLGVLIDISMKTIPRPFEEITLQRECTYQQAIERMNELAGIDLPVSATFFDGLNLYIRLSGASPAVEAGEKRIGGERAENNTIWQTIREHSHAFFSQDKALWRLSVPSDASYFELPGKQCIEWGGALRWLVSDADPSIVRTAAQRAEGSAILFRGGDRRGEIFHPLADGMKTLHKNLKQSFDPDGIFNPGRMYREF